MTDAQPTKAEGARWTAGRASAANWPALVVAAVVLLAAACAPASGPAATSPASDDRSPLDRPKPYAPRKPEFRLVGDGIDAPAQVDMLAAPAVVEASRQRLAAELVGEAPLRVPVGTRLRPVFDPLPAPDRVVVTRWVEGTPESVPIDPDGTFAVLPGPRIVRYELRGSWQAVDGWFALLLEAT